MSEQNRDSKKNQPSLTNDCFIDTDEEQLEKDGSDYKTDEAANKQRNHGHGNSFWYNSGQWDKD